MFIIKFTNYILTNGETLVIIQRLSHFSETASVNFFPKGVFHMYKVVKRDGATVEFDISKISNAMVKAFEAVGRQHHPSVTNLLALQVTSDFESKIKDGVVTVEDIQDSVEHVLADAVVFFSHCLQYSHSLSLHLPVI